MLTHLIQSRHVSLFLIDEPDIYLHADLQRQLLNILRDLGPDILIATHSVEILTEAEVTDIIIVNKSNKSGKRIRNPAQLQDAFGIVGSSLNPILTHLSKTRRALFVEGKDFKIISQFARKLGKDHIANRRDFAVIPIGGFNIQKTKNLLEGIETALGNKISSFVLLDKDFRSFGEVENICNDSKGIFGSLMVFDRKEIENYLLIPKAIERAIQKRLNSRSPIKPAQPSVSLDIMPYLESCIEEQHAHVLSQLLSENERFHREAKSSLHKSTINENFILQFAQH
jgi:energy-coupling factor transporter ATP-binding protein EcfA2